jgi:hypothetical protein
MLPLVLTRVKAWTQWGIENQNNIAIGYEITGVKGGQPGANGPQNDPDAKSVRLREKAGQSLTHREVKKPYVGDGPLNV